MKKGTDKSKKSFLPRIKLSEKARTRWGKFFRYTDLVLVIIAWGVFIFSNREKIPAPLSLMASFGMGRMLYYVVGGTLQGSYHDGYKKGLDLGGGLSKTSQNLIDALMMKIRVLEQQLSNKQPTDRIKSETTPSHGDTLRRFFESRGVKKE